MSIASRRLLLSGTVLLTALHAGLDLAPPRHVTHSHPVRHEPPATRDQIKALATAPMVFEPNRGQADPRVAFVARGGGYAVEIGDTRAGVHLVADRGQEPARLEMQVLGASSRARAVGADPQPGTSHYLVGTDPARHLRDVPHLGSVSVKAIYPLIDLVYYGNQSNLEYDFRLRPGANPQQIALRFRGQDSLEVSPAGDLIFRFGARVLRHPKPIVYELPGRAPVEGHFVIVGDGTVGFEVGEWDRTRTLVIDPTLVFGSYLGGAGNDTARGVAVDAARRGWDLGAPWRWHDVGRAGRAVIRGEEIDRFELWLPARESARYSGHLRVGDTLAPLPAGSQLDASSGRFTWAPGVGFVGSYDLVFVRWAGDRVVARHEVRVVLAPKGRGHVGVQVAIDVPRAHEAVDQPVVLAGWAADLDAAAGTGIDAVHVWAFPMTGGVPVFLGTPTLGGARPDVAAVHGDQFRRAGFALTLQGLVPGTYDLAAFPWSNVIGAFASPNVYA